MFAIGFVGAGQMATALAKGWQAAGLLGPHCLAADPVEAARTAFTQRTGVPATYHTADLPSSCDVILLAVKPQLMSAALAELAPHLTPNHLLISIAAGYSLDTLAEQLAPGTRLVRVMPNTPALVGACASAYALNASASAEDAVAVQSLFAAVGSTARMPEHLLDAVTGLSGSGPAYAFVMIDALADGGVKMGLARDVAIRLAAQTLLGAAKMVLESGQHPAQLKDAVASPGGTTIAGLHALERGAFRSAIIDAVEASSLRAAELGKRG